MKSFSALLRKELTEQLRSGKLTVLGILFVLFGIMNPAIAKLTPWLLEMMADSLKESGMTVTAVTVSAMDSWVQFYKNIPMALIAFLLMESEILTKEYRTGTLILSLTKGLSRTAVVLSKAFLLSLLWTLGYWGCFGITYAYNAYFWDNAVAQSLVFSAVAFWLFGMFTVALVLFFSVTARASSSVLIGTGGVVLLSYLVALFPKAARYLPTALTNGSALLYGSESPAAYTVALIITASASLCLLAFSIPLFRKKQL
jgi:ABC-2 type transport system permease protein